VDELALDRCFWRTVSRSESFRKWLLSKTKFSHLALELVTDEKWHQRWYRDPITKRDSETDILLIFFDVNSGKRYALHIENKPDHRKWEPLQSSNYRKRAIDRMRIWRYVDFQVVLLAPVSFISRYPTDACQFDIWISYEDVGVFIPEYLAEAEI
jgi:hypothetical protein